MLGDSSAAGMGADNRYQTVGAIIATGVSALTGRPVRLTNAAVIGAESSGLERQLANALEQVPRPDVAVIMVGANDVTHRINRAVAVRHLESTVQRLREVGAEVVVGHLPRPRHHRADPPAAAARSAGAGAGTSPQPRPSPSSRPAAAPSRSATCSARSSPSARTSCSARTGSTPRRPATPAARRPCCPACMPRSASGRATAEEDRLPDRRRGEGIGPVAVAAEQAVRDPGTEVSATEIAGQARGPRGRWAKLLRRPRNPPPARRPASRRGLAAGPAAKPGPRLDGPAAARAGSRGARQRTTSPGRRDQGHTGTQRRTAYDRR